MLRFEEFAYENGEEAEEIGDRYIESIQLDR